MTPARILIVDDDSDVLLALKLLLKENGYEVAADTDPRKIPALLHGAPLDAVFLDMNFANGSTDGSEGLRLLREIREKDPDAVVIPITAFGDIELAVKAVREGAADFILKPWTNEKLLATLSMALELKRTRGEVARLRSQQRQFARDMARGMEDMVGHSRAMRDIGDLIRKVAATDANVLIMGENGTGKELVARALHRESRRSAGVFVCVDMGSIVESLFESELLRARQRRLHRCVRAHGSL